MLRFPTDIMGTLNWVDARIPASYSLFLNNRITPYSKEKGNNTILKSGIGVKVHFKN
jgi:hypothetical protein